MPTDRPPAKAAPNPGTAARWKKALELRLSGFTYQQIADACGYSDHSSARYAIRRSMQFSLAEPAEELRHIEAARLDKLMQFVWPKKSDTEPVKANAGIGDLDQRARDQSNREKDRLTRLYAKVDRALKIMERRARLMGVDSPTLHKIEADIQVPPTELSQVILENKDARNDYLKALELASGGLRLTGGAGDAGDSGEVGAGAPSEDPDRDNVGGGERGD